MWSYPRVTTWLLICVIYMSSTLGCHFKGLIWSDGISQERCGCGFYE